MAQKETAKVSFYFKMDMVEKKTVQMDKKGVGRNMSILIKGMRKPSKCAACMFKLGNQCVLKKEQYNTWFQEYETCPLIEIPDGHGRLIDEDVLMEMAEKERGNYDAVWRKTMYSMGEIFHAIRCTPTIIPADKDGET